MQIASHGGRCCGVKHVWGFYREATIEEFKALLDNYNYLRGLIGTGRDSGNSRGKLIEMVATDRQIRENRQLFRDLKELGVKRVARWFNSTGGICNLLVLYPEWNSNTNPWDSL